MSAGGHLIRNRIALRESIDLDELIIPGVYAVSEPSNGPDDSSYMVHVSVAVNDSGRTVLQVAFDLESDGAASARVYDGSTWGDWTALGGGVTPGTETDLSIGTHDNDSIEIESSTGDDVEIPSATTSLAGLLSAADKTKLDGIAAGAEVNVQADWEAESGDAFIANKPTLGTMALETASDYVTTADGDTFYQPLNDDLTEIANQGGTTAAGRSVLGITDPNADRVMAWDDSVGGVVPIAVADITTEASPTAGDFLLAYTAEGALVKVDWDDLPAGGSGISEVVEDTTPQLGGDLDLNGSDVTGTGNIDVTGSVTVTDEAYDATNWNADLSVPTKNAVRDVVESLSSVYQPLDSDLTSIAALTTASFGRGLLELANAAALGALVDSQFLTPAEGNAAYQPIDSDLTSIAALTTTSHGRGYLTLADAAAGRTHLALGTIATADAEDYLGLDALLQTIVGEVAVAPLNAGIVGGEVQLTYHFNKVTNDEAFDLLPPPTGSGSAAVLITNDSTAGAIGLDEWDIVTGDAFDTDNGSIFMCVWVIMRGSGSTALVLNVTKVV